MVDVINALAAAVLAGIALYCIYDVMVGRK